MSEKFEERVLNDLSELRETQTDIRIDLREHMRRTDILEERQESFEAALKPVSNHVYMMAGAFKLVTGLGVLAAIAKALFELFR